MFPSRPASGLLQPPFVSGWCEWRADRRAAPRRNPPMRCPIGRSSGRPHLFAAIFLWWPFYLSTNWAPVKVIAITREEAYVGAKSWLVIVYTIGGVRRRQRSAIPRLRLRALPCDDLRTGSQCGAESACRPKRLALEAEHHPFRRGAVSFRTSAAVMSPATKERKGSAASVRFSSTAAWRAADPSVAQVVGARRRQSVRSRDGQGHGRGAGNRRLRVRV
jgi:hypothetical protein